MNSKKWIIVIVAVMLVFGAYFVINNPMNPVVKTQVENVFVDINNDGMVDLLLSGEVILNTGATNFPSQP